MTSKKSRSTRETRLSDVYKEPAQPTVVMFPRTSPQENCEEFPSSPFPPTVSPLGFLPLSTMRRKASKRFDPKRREDH